MLLEQRCHPRSRPATRSPSPSPSRPSRSADLQRRVPGPLRRVTGRPRGLDPGREAHPLGGPPSYSFSSKVIDPCLGSVFPAPTEAALLTILRRLEVRGGGPHVEPPPATVRNVTHLTRPRNACDDPPACQVARRDAGRPSESDGIHRVRPRWPPGFTMRVPAARRPRQRALIIPLAGTLLSHAQRRGRPDAEEARVPSVLRRTPGRARASRSVDPVALPARRGPR